MTSLLRTARLALATVALALIPHMAPAQVPGADAPAFADTVAAWLDGTDDLSALQGLGTLAAEGNTAAQILLARIGLNPHLTAHVTDGMTRADRIALLRQPGGLSGRSWMTAAAETSPLAQAFLDNATQSGRIDSLRTLYTYGETAAATRSLPGAVSYDPNDVGRVAQDFDVMPDEARIFIAAHTAQAIAFQSGSTITIPNPISDRNPPELALIWRPVYPREWSEDPAARELALAHSINIPSFAPLRRFCGTHCGDEISACMAAGASLLAAQAPLMPFASPSEALIPTDDYWASPRFDADLTRLLSASVDPETQSGFSAMNACFMDAADG